MRWCLAAVTALGVASAPGASLAQDGVTVFTPAPVQGGVAVPVAPEVPASRRATAAARWPKAPRVFAAGSRPPVPTRPCGGRR